MNWLFSKTKVINHLETGELGNCKNEKWIYCETEKL